MLRDRCIFFEKGAYGQGYNDPPYCTFYNVDIDKCEDCIDKPCQHFYDKETICNLLRDHYNRPIFE